MIASTNAIGWRNIAIRISSMSFMQSLLPKSQAAGSRSFFRARHDAPIALITITVMLGLIMAIIDATIVNVALNDIAGNLGASIDEVSWVATGYILASVITMPLNGWLTAYFGRKNFYAGCLAIFTIASILCGTAHSIWQLVFYRVLQGFGGGALQPTAQAILFETYPPEKRGQAMAIFGLGAMVGPAIGPTLGGYIIDNYSWPLIFYINIPIGIVAFIMTLMFIPNPSFLQKPKGGIDWIGLSLLSAGLENADSGARLVRRIEGDFYTVMGFPLGRFTRTLAQLGLMRSGANQSSP